MAMLARDVLPLEHFFLRQLVLIQTPSPITLPLFLPRPLPMLRCLDATTGQLSSHSTEYRLQEGRGVSLAPIALQINYEQ